MLLKLEVLEPSGESAVGTKKCLENVFTAKCMECNFGIPDKFLGYKFLFINVCLLHPAPVGTSWNCS